MSDKHQPMNKITFDEFPIPTYDLWYQTALESLKGASFERRLVTATYEGLHTQPIYHRNDIAEIEHIHSWPGSPPFVRGTAASGKRTHIAQALDYSSPEAFNHALRQALENGQTALALDLSDWGQSGFKSPISSLEAVASALREIDLNAVPLFVNAGAHGLPILALLAAHRREQGASPTSLHGYIGSDPIGELAKRGSLPHAITDSYLEIAQVTDWAIAHSPRLGTVLVNTACYHQAGATAVQELAIAIATGAAYIRALLQHGFHIDQLTPHIHFDLAIGSQFFTEVAKLRAARMLWSQVVHAFGGSTAAQQMNLHGHTGNLNKSTLDPYNNVLRTTLEAFSGVLGTVDSLRVTPFNQLTNHQDAFASRIARNQQLILHHECNLAHVIDPAGGSWYLEYLTDWLARQAWQVFQEIEQHGGIVEVLKTGWLQDQIATIATQRLANIQQRKDVLIGVNMYAAPDTTTSVDTPAEQQVERRQSEQNMRVEQLLALVTNSGDRFESAIQAILAGATVDDILQAMRSGSSSEALHITPLQPIRLAEPFEALRQNAVQFQSSNGKASQIFLANMGNYRARAEFTTGFFEVGGFEIIDQGVFQSEAEAANAAIASGAEAMVICSTDDMYPQIVEPLIRHVRAEKPDMIVILAGYPQDQVEAHRTAGVNEFIHIRCNCYAINHWLQQRIGMSA